MAADDIPDWGVVPYVSKATIDAMSNNNDKALFIYNHGNIPIYKTSSGSISVAFSLVCLDNTTAHVAVYKDGSRYAVVVASMDSFTDGVYYQSYSVTSSSHSAPSQASNATQYIDMYYLTVAPYNWFVSDSAIFSNYYVYETRAEAVAVLYESFDGSGGGGGGSGGGDGLFVASVYNSSPFVVSDSFLSSSGSSLDGSYNIDDAVYTPVVEHEGSAFSSGLSVKPRSNVAQYLLWENQSYSSADYSSLTLSGTYTFYVQADLTTASGTTSRYIYPSSMQLAVNGEPVYFSSVNYQGNGILSFDGCTLRLSDYGGQIYSIGVMANYSGTIREVAVLSDWSVGFFGASDLTVSTAEATAPTYPEDPTVGDVLPGLDGVQDAIESSNRKVDNILQMLINLPQNIANLIGGLFIPQNLDSYYDSYTQLLESKLGFVWQSGSLVADFFATFVGYFSSGVAPYDFLFGPVVVPMGGESYTIVEQTAVSLDNDLLDIVRPVLDSIVMLVCTIGVANVGRDMLASIISGASYMDFLNRKGSGEA